MEKVEFSFANGGALANRLRKMGVLNRERKPIAFRIAIAISLTWLPLLILTAVQGVAVGKKTQISFIFDLIQHARFLVALPLAILAEPYISSRIEKILNRFALTATIADTERPYLKEAISRAKTCKDSTIAEIVIIALVYLYTALGLERDFSLSLSSWKSSGGLAEFWFTWISMPIFLFFWFRWLWRQGIWAYLLFRISRLKLQLISTHGDATGGLTFVSIAHRRFSILIFAISSILCASIGEEILYLGASLHSFELELSILFLICLAILLGPLLFFTPALIRAKLRDLGKYGILAMHYGHDFDVKWTGEKNQENKGLLGSPDIQSLADMKNSYEGVAHMRSVLPDRGTVLIFLAAFLLPVSPLVTTVIPLPQVLSQVFKLLLR